jgi:hypothetical protein
MKLMTAYTSAADRDTAAAAYVAEQSAPRCKRRRDRMAGARETTERGELQQWVADLAAWLGLLHYHTHDSRHSPAGFPDSVFVGTQTLFRELKTDWAALQPAQKDWGMGLLESGQDWAVWRPSDWFPSAPYPRGLIKAELEAITFKASGTPHLAAAPWPGNSRKGASDGRG